MKLNSMEISNKANEIRKDIVAMITASGSGHPGGSLSAADILATLYFNVMNIDPADTKKVGRDKFVLSKGHAAPVLYAALARRGFFAVDELLNLRKMGALLQGHPDMKTIPGVEMSTGSLGQGFSASVGMAIAAKLDQSDSKTYVLLGDGEMNEGIVWEAAMSAAHYKLGNLIAILDYNGLQIDGKNDDVMKISPIDSKFEAFGWNVLHVDGHNVDDLLANFAKAADSKDQPTILIAKTIKGKGVSFMENQAGWHGKAPSADEHEKAMSELGGKA